MALLRASSQFPRLASLHRHPSHVTFPRTRTCSDLILAQEVSPNLLQSLIKVELNPSHDGAQLGPR